MCRRPALPILFRLAVGLLARVQELPAGHEHRVLLRVFCLLDQDASRYALPTIGPEQRDRAKDKGRYPDEVPEDLVAHLHHVLGHHLPGDHEHREPADLGVRELDRLVSERADERVEGHTGFLAPACNRRGGFFDRAGGILDRLDLVARLNLVELVLGQVALVNDDPIVVLRLLCIRDRRDRDDGCDRHRSDQPHHTILATLWACTRGSSRLELLTNRISYTYSTKFLRPRQYPNFWNKRALRRASPL